METLDKETIKKINKLILLLIKSMEGKLEDYLINDLINYLDNNEFGLSLELLCEYILEYNIFISKYEYETITNIINIIWNNDESNINIQKLVKQVQK